MLDISNGLKITLAGAILCLFAGLDFFLSHRLPVDTDLFLFMSGITVLSNGVVANVAHGVGVLRGLNSQTGGSVLNASDLHK